MSKVLFVGDAHGDLSFLAEACAQAAEEGCSRVVQVGDFGLWPTNAAADDWLRRVDGLVVGAGLEGLFWVDGNHDWHDRLADYRSSGARDANGFVICAPASLVRYAPRGHRWCWDGVRFAGFGGAFSVDWRGRTPGVSWWPDDEAPSEEDFHRLVAGGEVDVLVTHEAPLGVDLRGEVILRARDREKAEAVRRMVRMAVNRLAPRLAVHGHWHARKTSELHTRFLFEDEPREFTTRVESLGANVYRWDLAWLVVDLEDLNR